MLTLWVRRFLLGRRAASEKGGKGIGGEGKREREKETGGATVGQGGKETGLYQPKGEERTTGNDAEERVDSKGREVNNKCSREYI